MVDLDNFKLVNDLFGHDMGDRVLQITDDIIRENIRKTDTVSRIGGDEFLVFLEDLKDGNNISPLIERLNARLTTEANALLGEEHGIPLGISAGAVMIPQYGRDYEELFSMADDALYLAKQNGKHEFALYDKNTPETESNSEDLEQEIERISIIVGERNDSGGALFLGQEAFAMVYRFSQRFYKRYGGCSVRVLFSVTAREKEGTLSEAAVSQLSGILQNTLRKSDLIFQNRSNQFFVLLNEHSKFEARNVLERIMNGWKECEHDKNTELRYSLRNDEYLPENKFQ